MQLMSWTDERIEERFDGIDRRFDKAAKQTNRRFDDARRETNRQFDEVNRRLDGVDVQLAELRGGIATLQATLARASFGVIASMAGVIVAILIKGS